MASTLTINELVERNKAYVSTHQPLPTLEELGAMNIEPPHIVILTCCDPRIHPEIFLGLKPTDAVLTFRNINGHAATVIKDIVAFDISITITDIMMVHHTDCGATHYTDDMIRSGLQSRLPDDESIATMDFGAVSSIEQSIKDDIAIIRASPYIRKELAERTVGFVLDIKTGALTKVEV